MTKPFAIYHRDGELAYLGLHKSADDCWRVALGWPSPEEIRAYRRKHGAVCIPVTVTPTTNQEST